MVIKQRASEGGADSGPLRVSIEALAESGIIGFAWLDDALIAFDRFGSLTDWIPLGEKITESVPYFLGLDTDLLDLQDEPGQAFVLSSVGIPQPDTETLKVSFEVFWNESEEQYCLIVHRLGARAAAEYELIKQVRARRIAEENLRNTEGLLQQKQELLGLMAADAPVALAMFDREYRYLYATQRWSEMFGLAFEPMIGRSHFEIAPVQPQISREVLDYCLAGGNVVTPPQQFVGKEGKSVLVRWRHGPWHRANALVGGVISVAEVVTEAVAAQNQLERKMQQISASNRRLEQFAAIAGHDLQAPLRGIEMALEQIKPNLPGAAPAVVTGLAAIESQANRMRRMLADLMSYTMGISAPNRDEDDDLQAILARIAVSLSGAEAFSIRLQSGYELPAGSPLPMDVVLRNLVQNAIVHHDRTVGEVLIVSQQAEGCHRVTVSDDGPGIAAEHQAQIFEPFWRGDQGRHAAGSGMGLALVQQIVDLHHGSIKVISPCERNRGTRFEITVPLDEDS